HDKYFAVAIAEAEAGVSRRTDTLKGGAPDAIAGCVPERNDASAIVRDPIIADRGNTAILGHDVFARQSAEPEQVNGTQGYAIGLPAADDPGGQRNEFAAIAIEDHRCLRIQQSGGQGQVIGEYARAGLAVNDGAGIGATIQIAGRIGENGPEVEPRSV